MREITTLGAPSEEVEATAVHLTFGKYQLHISNDDESIYISRGNGEAMQTSFDKLEPVLEAALAKFWEREY